MGLMDDSFGFADLSKKYSGFAVPAAKLKIGGKDILGMKDISIGRIQVKLSLKAAGSADFTMNSCYDHKNSSFLQALKDTAVLGKTVEVELGYGSSTQLVFKGFIASVNMGFDVEAGISFHITAMDARRLMMTDNSRSVSHTETKYSDIVKKILKRYEPLCTASVESTSEELKEPVSQECSDYDFIAEKAGKEEGMEFFVVGDTAYFRKTASNKSPAVTLGIGTGLKTFERGAIYLNRKIQVQGQGTSPEQKVMATALAKSNEKQVNVLSEPGLTVIKTASDSSAFVQVMAEAYVKKLEGENSQASGTSIGLPQIVPGRFIKIENVDSLINKKYYVTEVSHTIGRDGFVTSFETSGWE